MVVSELSDRDVTHIFHALADSTRRDILRRTLVTDVSVSQLAESYETLTAVEGGPLVSLVDP